MNVTGKVCVDENGLACIETQITRDNPNLYQIPLADILEEFLHKPVEVELLGGAQPQVVSGVLVLQQNGELAVETAAKVIPIKDLVDGCIGKDIEVEGIGDIDKVDEATGQPKAYKITLQPKI